jgi:hypothetical protein
MRVTGMSLGDGRNNSVRIQAVQDAFSTPEVSYVATEGSEWTDINVPPAVAPAEIAFEAPYYELVQVMGQGTIDAELASDPEAGYVGAAATRPTSAINFVLTTDAGAGYVEIGTPGDFCPTCTIDTAIDQEDETVEVSDLESETSIAVGSHGQIDDELIKVVSLVGTTLTFKRGILDTVPADHSAGARIFFWDEFSGRDPEQYTLAEVVNAKVLPVTSQGQLAESAATALPVTLDQRAYRPYPPGNVEVNGEAYPTLLEGTLTVTWAHRDRTQQTGANFVEQDEADIGPEAGTTYNVRIYDDDTDLLMDSDLGVSGVTTALAPAGSFDARLEVEAERDGVVSWQPQVRRFTFSGTGARADDTDSVRVTESGDIRVEED